MAQTTYADMTSGFAGMRADNGDYDAVTRLNSEASLEIPFGVIVAEGSGDQDAILPAADTAVLVGAVMANYRAAEDIGTTGLKADTLFPVMRKGRILVTVEENVVKGDRLYVRYAAGSGGTQLGACRASAVIGETIDASSKGVYLTAASSGGLAVLEVDFTNA